VANFDAAFDTRNVRELAVVVIQQREIGMSREHRMRVAVLGSGGLGKAAARIIAMKREARLTAICDSHGFVSSAEGLDGAALSTISGDLVDGVRQLAVEAGDVDAAR